MKYLKRIIDDIIEEKLQTTGGVVIKGPKWCGKTTTSKVHAKSILELQNDEEIEKNKMLAGSDMSLLLKGDKPRLIDEWQEIPRIWNSIKSDIDKENKTGLYILTGSATPKDDTNLHSGVGRFSFVEMKTMSLFESGESNGSISLKDILDNKVKVSGQTSNITYQELAYITCRGGWPSSLNKDKKIALNIVKEYLNAICESDISRIDGVARNPELARNILKAYARHISTISSNDIIYDDIKYNFGDVSRQTIQEYIKIFKRLYVIDEIDAWNPNLRSKTGIRTSSKKSFIDPSIAIAALQCSPEELALDPKTFGFVFENLVNRDLSVYVNKIGGYLRHYRDRYGLECDHVIHFHNGKYGLIQTKLGTYAIEQGIDKLRELRDLIKENNKVDNRVKEPSFLMVITGGDIAFTTTDGILVVPISCLKD
ncbi:MAG: DUF4143 domain-containing protein [Clostridia bacterium]